MRESLTKIETELSNLQAEKQRLESMKQTAERSSTLDDAKALQPDIEELERQIAELKGQIDLRNVDLNHDALDSNGEDVIEPHSESEPTTVPLGPRKITTRYSGEPYDAAQEATQKEERRKRIGKESIAKLRNILSE